VISNANNMVGRLRASYYRDPFNHGALATQSPHRLAGIDVYLSAAYTYMATQYVRQPRTRVEIDLNVRVRGNDTFVGFEDLSGPVAVGEVVEVYESESGVAGEGRFTEIDGDRELVYLSVDWPSLKEQRIPSDEEGPAPVTQFMYLDANTATIATDRQPWTQLITWPCLAGISGGEGSIWVTAPIYESSGLLPGVFLETVTDMWRPNVSFGNLEVAVAV